MTDNDLKAQLDRIESHANKAETNSGCVLGFVIALFVVGVVAALSKACAA